MESSVNSIMVAARNDLKILQAIVCPIVIEMVNNIFRTERDTSRFFNHMPMFPNIFPIHANIDIPISQNTLMVFFKDTFITFITTSKRAILSSFFARPFFEAILANHASDIDSRSVAFFSWQRTPPKSKTFSRAESFISFCYPIAISNEHLGTILAFYPYHLDVDFIKQEANA